MRIGILGDLHGNTAAARFMLWSMHSMGVKTVVQVGDFGIYSDHPGTKFANKVNEYAKQFGVTIYVVPGNHENWRIINEIFQYSDRDEFAAWRDRIILVPRGMRWTWGGMSFVGLGGAPSVNRKQAQSRDELRTRKAKEPRNRDWYWEEQITGADVDFVVAGGHANVMITHDAPHGIQGVDRMIRGNPHGWHYADLLYAEEGRRLLTEAFQGVAPSFLFHGHYHTPINEHIFRPSAESLEYTHVIGLAKEFENYSMAILDTESGDATNIDHTALLFQYRKDNFTWPPKSDSTKT